MAIETSQCARHCLVSVIGPTMAGVGEQIFKIRGLRRLKNVILRMTCKCSTSSDNHFTNVL